MKGGMTTTKSPFVDWVSFTKSNLGGASKEQAAGYDAFRVGRRAAAAVKTGIFPD